MRIQSLVCKFGHNYIKLLESKAIICRSSVIYVSAVEHFKDLFIIHDLSSLLGNGFKLLEVNHPIFIFIKQRKNSLKSIFRLSFSNLRCNGVYELVKIDWFIFILEGVDKF